MDKSFDEIMEDNRQTCADSIGVTVEEFESMKYSEIKKRMRKKNRAEFINARWFGALRLRFKDWLYRKKGGGKSIIYGDIYE